MYAAVYSANSLCPLISMMSYYCNSYCRGCIRLPEAVRGHAQLNTAACERKQNAKNNVKKIIIICPLSAMADTLLLLHNT